MQLALICQMTNFHGLIVWSTPSATSMCPAMDSSNFPTGTPLIYLSMMIQGDDGYGEMAIVMMMAIVMTMKKRLQLVGRLGNSQCLPLVFTGLHRWC